MPFGGVVQKREKPSSQDVIVPLARKLVGQGEKVIVFRNMRGPAQGCAKYLAAELGLPAAAAVLAALPAHDLSAASQDLRVCLAGGTAFHNTNLLAEERDTLATRLEFGLPEAALPLLRLPTRLTRGQYLALHRAGLAHVSDVLSLEMAELARHVGEPTAALLVSGRAAASES